MDIRVHSHMAFDPRSDLLRAAAEFFAGILLDKRMARTIKLDIDIVKRMSGDGECANEDGTKRSRWFTITLKDKSISAMIRTLAHEMVHVKQYARNELSRSSVMARGNMNMVVKWKGEVWTPGRGEHSYFDSPWEIEAFGKEAGLIYRWNTKENNC
jgi:hypothetical protein